MSSYLQINNLSKRIGELILFENISFGISREQKVALIARNGAGKTSLLNIIAGLDTPDEGSVTFNREVSLGYLAQIPQLIDENTVLEEVFSAANEQIRTIKAYEQALEHKDEFRIHRLVEQMDALEAWDYEVKARQILTVLALHDLDKPVRLLSGGQKKRVALAKTLILEPNFLILDEPTNHLDLDMIEWLEEYLMKSNITLFMVTHDRYFLDNVCNELLELDDNTLYRYHGNYSRFLQKRAERIENMNTGASRAQNLLRKETEWVNRMPKARGTKARFRLDAYRELKQKAGYVKEEQQVTFNVQAERLGKKILDLKNLSKGFGGMKLIDRFSYTFSRYEKVGIAGKNGTGKTTFLNLITGNMKPDKGRIDIGETVKFGYYRQSGMAFNENEKVIDAVRKIAEVVRLGDGRELTVTQFLNYFLFPPQTHYQYISKLSGGEKSRLYLLSILMGNPNFLVLDEPTNDLDILTLNVLEEYLISFRGCVVVVSHDRYFMDKIIDHLFVFEEDGHIKDYPGNYTLYRQHANVASGKQTSGSATPGPKKGKPKNTASNKLSYKEKYELEQVEQQLASLEEEKDQLTEALNSGNLASGEIQEKSARLAEILEKLGRQEERWLELHEKMENPSR